MVAMTVNAAGQTEVVIHYAFRPHPNAFLEIACAPEVLRHETGLPHTDDPRAVTCPMCKCEEPYKQHLAVAKPRRKG